jgi:hypothetical protein
MHIDRKGIVKRTNTPITMKEGRDIWLQPLLDGASDNSVAEIMDSRSSIHSIYPVRQENRKEWFTPPLVIWFIRLYF